MPKFRLAAYEASRDGEFISIKFRLDTGAIMPRDIEARNTQEAMAALEAYKAEAGKSGKGLAVTMSLHRGERAPNGFNKANAKHYHYVNL